MTRDLSPRGFTDWPAFRDAFVARRMDGAPKFNRDDSYSAASLKLEAHILAKQAATEDAMEAWDWHIETAAELTDRDYPGDM